MMNKILFAAYVLGASTISFAVLYLMGFIICITK